MNITPRELKARLDAAERIRLIDVREAEEWDTCRLPGAELIPLSQFQRLAERKLDPADTIVVYCHHGMRSLRAQSHLKALGYENVINLTGGIDAWSVQVDPTVKRY
jgi:adenylyltransferase/sulfurtransferase